MSKNSTSILHLIEKMVDIRVKYKEIKNNEEERPKSTVMGKSAIMYNIIFLILIACGVAVLIAGIGLLGTIGILFGIILAFAGAVFILVSFVYLLLALNCAIKQLILNKRAIGWVSLTITLLIIVAAVVAVAIGLSSVL
ncbi:MAG: hypothetical protein K2N84_03155 [Clostridia bacterium]|nr:hypothetical protein [Clostridia bacterium]